MHHLGFTGTKRHHFYFREAGNLVDPLFFILTFNHIQFTGSEAQLTGTDGRHVPDHHLLQDWGTPEVFLISDQHGLFARRVGFKHKRAGAHRVGLKPVITLGLQGFLRHDKAAGISRKLGQKQGLGYRVFQGNDHGIGVRGREADAVVFAGIG